MEMFRFAQHDTVTLSAPKKLDKTTPKRYITAKYELCELAGLGLFLIHTQKEVKLNEAHQSTK